MAVVVVWIVVAALTIAAGYAAARRGADLVFDVRESLTFDTLVDPLEEIPLEVSDAQDEFQAAEIHFARPWLLPVRAMPVLGRQLRAAEGMVRSADEVLGAAVVAGGRLEGVLSQDWSVPENRVVILDELHSILSDAKDAVLGVDLGPGEALFGPIHRYRAEIAGEIAQLEDVLVRADAAVGGLAGFLRGPSRYLFFAANNAEMRAGSGMFLSMGVLTTDNGRLSLADVGSVVDVKVTGDVPVDPDVATLWSQVDTSYSWRNLGFTPRFDATAQQAAAMWEAAGKEPVDGVIVADAEVLFALASAMGPVEFAGSTMTADDLRYYVLEEQYRRFGGFDDDAIRRDLLGVLAARVLGAFDSGDFDAAALMAGLQSAASGRHLLLWSSDPEQEAAWEAAGVAGVLGPDSMMVSVINRGGNKLDSFLNADVRLEVAAAGPSDGTTRAKFRVALENTVAEDEIEYIAGPHPSLDTVAGEYRGLLVLNLPGWVKDFTALSGAETSVGGPDGATLQYATPVSVKRGETIVYEYEFTLPAHGEIEVAASARLPAAMWEVVTGRERLVFSDAAATVVVW